MDMRKLSGLITNPYFKVHIKEPYKNMKILLPNVCLKDIHLDNVRIFGQGVQKFVQLNLYTAL